MCSSQLANTALVCQGHFNDEETSNTLKGIETAAKTAQPLRGDPSTLPEIISDDMPLIRGNLASQRNYETIQNVFVRLFPKKTISEDYCQRGKLTPYNPGTIKAIQFLTEMYNSGLGYSAISTKC